MAKKQGPRMRISVECEMGKVDGFPVVRRDDRVIDLSGMSEIGQRDLKKLVTDHRILGEILQRNPKELSGIISDVLAGRHKSAKAKAESIGLTEESFQQKSGGLIGFVILVIVIVLAMEGSAG